MFPCEQISRVRQDSNLQSLFRDQNAAPSRCCLSLRSLHRGSECRLAQDIWLLQSNITASCNRCSNHDGFMWEDKESGVVLKYRNFECHCSLESDSRPLVRTSRPGPSKPSIPTGSVNQTRLRRIAHSRSVVHRLATACHCVDWIRIQVASTISRRNRMRDASQQGLTNTVHYSYLELWSHLLSVEVEVATRSVRNYDLRITATFDIFYDLRLRVLHCKIS